ncbi:hypothetical protein [Ruegeria lacuscaerulensis]|uniref:hypothetical protein n=1 Tax=Ruegeria lacuscaerulensis TaxID=55218 RepID=UPI001479B345|nr:hypothetical protein [Ruegeria lacuscaerulensis]
MNSTSLGRDFAWLSLLCFVAMLLLYLPLILDPFVRHDDFPALLGTLEMAYAKTLDEGRWLNYWWQFRPVLWSSPVNFILYLAAWSLFSASTAVILLDREVGGWYKGYFALFISFSLPAYLISFWFNTLLPGVWVVALYAIAAAFLSHRTALALLIVAVPLSFMAYPSYPFLLLTLILLSRKAPKSYKSMAITLGVFIASLALGVLTVYSLNYIYHGVFGIPVAEWRSPTEVNSVADLLENIQKQKDFLIFTLKQVGGGVADHGMAMQFLFAAAWVLMFIWNRYLGVAILVAVIAGLVPLVGKALMSGVQVPLRALGWVWILFGFSLVSVAVHLSKTPGRWLNVTRITILYVVFFKLLIIGKGSFLLIPHWQNATRDLANEVPEVAQNVYIYGDYWGLEGARHANIQTSEGLRLRLRYLTGAEVYICDEKPQDCEDVSPPFHPRDWTHVPVVEVEDQNAFVLIPGPAVGP